MKTMSMSRIAISIAVGLLLAQGPALAALGCENPGKTHRLKFKVKGDECVEKVKKEDDDDDADTISVCVTDTVIWQVNGPAKSVVFDGDSPFDWQDSGFEGNKIIGIVRAGTEGQEFKYSVMVDGLSCVLDPRIVVDR
jgi:hypothetical protein